METEFGKTVELLFTREKETRNTVRFQEVSEVDKPPVVGTLYVQKWFAGMVDKVKVRIERVY